MIDQSMHELRVIVVGRTGLEQKLRRDASIELVRARTPMDALGELADPIDDASPARAVVVVSDDTDASEPTSDRSAFLAALRSIDPAVRVLRASSNGDPVGAGYDGRVDPEADSDELRAALLKADTAQSMGGAGVAPGASGVVADHIADEAIAAALMRGQDVVPVAVELIRVRTGDASVSFVSGAKGHPTGSVPVSGPDGRVLGALVSGAAPAGELERHLGVHARWLAGWVRAGALQQELREAAFRDPLTGAWNRRYFDRYLPACLERAKERRLPVTLMLFDIDNFKLYNDQYGHPAGDEILTETVRLLDSVIRPHDRVCRVGGDEFAVIFFEPTGPRDPGSIPPADVFMLAERFQSQICHHRFPKLGRDAPGTLTISGGLATFPWDGTTPQALIEHADQLALRSKQQGKNVLTLGVGAELYRAKGCPPAADPPLG